MYERFFGLEDEPFRLTPDPRYLYLSPKHAEALAHLRLGLTDSSGFVCITGDVGTGKTTLLRTFLAELGPNVTAASIFAPPPSVFELLRSLCRELGCFVAGLSHAQLIEELHAYLIEQYKAGRVCVVVFDEAQAFSIELLEQIRLLLNFETDTHKLLRIVLAGQPQLRKLLLHPGLAQLNQRITLRWHLGPLSYRETVTYVDHRLSVAAGGRPVSLFTRPALRLLHSVSGGVPRVLNMIAHRALLAAYIARQTSVTRRWVARAYHEIQAVPLPGTLSPLRKATWAVAGLGIGAVLVAFGGPYLDQLLNAPTQAAPAQLAASRPPVANQAPAIAPAAATPTAPALSVARSAAASPSPIADAAGSPPESVRRVSAVELEQRLAGMDADTSARTATQTILTAWGAAALGAGDANLESATWRRGLQALWITANSSMLRLLDIPALLALRVPGTQRVCYVALLGMDESRVVLAIDGAPVTLDADLLDRLWSGQAHIIWRDFDGLRPVLGRGAKGVGVLRLQELLQRVDASAHESTGVFEDSTEAAVRGFQRSHRLDPDGLVGPLTTIVLYSTAGSSYARPTLRIGAQAPS